MNEWEGKGLQIETQLSVALCAWWIILSLWVRHWNRKMTASISTLVPSHSGPTAAAISKETQNIFNVQWCTDISDDFSPHVTQRIHIRFIFSVCVCVCVCVCVWFCVCFPVLGPCPGAEARRCNSIYKGFAQCLMALGDSLTDSARKDEDTHEIHSICRSVSMNTQMVPHKHIQISKQWVCLTESLPSFSIEICISKPNGAVRVSIS